MNGDGASGVAGDDSEGVSIGENERPGGLGEPKRLGGQSSVDGNCIAGGRGGSSGGRDESCCKGDAFKDDIVREVVGLCSAAKSIVELPLCWLLVSQP